MLIGSNCTVMKLMNLVSPIYFILFLGATFKKIYPSDIINRKHKTKMMKTYVGIERKPSRLPSHTNRR